MPHLVLARTRAALLCAGMVISGPVARAQAASHGSTAGQAEVAQVPAVEEALARLLASHPRSYQVWLRDAWRATVPLKGLQMADVEALARRMGLQRSEVTGGGSLRACYVLKRGLFTFAHSQPLDAYLLVDADNATPATYPARPGRVRSAHAALGLACNEPLEYLRRDLRPPRGSALARALASRTLYLDSWRWPVVKSVLVYYGPLRWVSNAESEFGLFVEVDLAGSRRDPPGQAGVKLFFPSGLDPQAVEVGEGAAPRLPWFKPHDTLEKMQIISDTAAGRWP